MKNLITLFVLISITVISCTKEKTPAPTQILFPYFENSDLKMEAVSSSIPSENIKDVFFFNETTGIVINYDGKIYKTNDGGMTWNLKYSDPTPDQPLYQILFTDENSGYVVGGADGCTGANCFIPGGIILKTIDGGETWSKIFHMSNVEFLSIAQNNSGDLFVTANGSSGNPPQSFGRILKSHDAGLSWTIVKDTSYGLKQLAFNNGFGYCTGTGSIIKSNDNGNSWNQTTALNHYTTDIAFSEGIGYCIADMHTIYKTEDNGDNWLQIFDSWSSYKLNPLSENNCLIWGSGPYTGGCFGTYHGVVRQTKNSGSAWVENEFSDISSIQCGDFYSQNDGYAITQNDLGLGSTLIKVKVK